MIRDTAAQRRREEASERSKHDPSRKVTADKAALIHDGRREKVTDAEDGGTDGSRREQEGG